MAADLQILPVKVDIIVPWKSQLIFEAHLTDKDGVDIDITLDDVVLTVKEKLTSAVALFSIGNGPGSPGSHVTPLQGRTRFTITEAQSTPPASVTDKAISWRYEIRRVINPLATPNGFPWFEGRFTLRAVVGL